MYYFLIRKPLLQAGLVSAIMFSFLTTSCRDDHNHLNGDRGLEISEGIKDSMAVYTDNFSNPNSYLDSLHVIKNSDLDLIRRAEEYFEAIHDDNFDSKKVVRYMYPRIFTYLNDKKSVYYETDVEKVIREPVQKLKAMVKQANASYDMDVHEIGKKIISGDKKIYFLKFALTIKKDINSHTLDDYILGISLGSDQEWTFLEVNETAEELLRSEFSLGDINAVMTEYTRLGLNR